MATIDDVVVDADRAMREQLVRLRVIHVGKVRWKLKAILACMWIATKITGYKIDVEDASKEDTP